MLILSLVMIAMPAGSEFKRMGEGGDRCGARERAREEEYRMEGERGNN